MERVEMKERNKKSAKFGGFESLGLNLNVFKGIKHKGYKVPTPIQRKNMPLILFGSDVVAMASTGSGKLLPPCFTASISISLRLELGPSFYPLLETWSFRLSSSPKSLATSQLSENRQTLVFSATLPSALAEFAKAGLRDP